MRIITAAFVMSALLVAACGASGPPRSGSPTSPAATAGSGEPEILPLLISSEILKGPNRFVFSLTDRANRLVAAPDVKVRLRFHDIAKSDTAVAFTKEARFLWAIEGQQGLYVASVDFQAAGRWGTNFDATFPNGAVKSVRADYTVAASGTTPALGAKVPSIDTPTASAVGGDLKRLTTDQAPDPRLYATSVAGALLAGKPFVLSFATPAFCETRLCGPTLEIVKRVAKDYPAITFINVEPYKMAFTDGRLQPELDGQGQLQAAAWTNAWGLRSEPYTFVIRGDGRVGAKFEGILGADELRAALDAL